MSQTSARQRARNGGRRAPRVLLIGVALAALGVTFALGALVGRHLAHRPQPVSVASEPVRRPGPAPRRGGLSEPLPERAASQEKLTFYQTLTAPLGTAPATNADATSKAEPARPRPAAERPVPPPAPPATALAPRPARPANGASPSSSASTAPTPADTRAAEWAVQVGAFKDRGQAESIRRPLAAAGFDAYLTAATADGDQVRYKVRVGGFRTREEAARMADRIRQERSLTAFVTPR